MERGCPLAPQNPRDPNDRAYWWSHDFELAVSDAALHGIELAVMIKGSPRWANGGLESNWAPRAADYAHFATALARKFPTIKLWMIWGEPTRERNFMPQGRAGARRYARILDAAYGALEAGRPRQRRDRGHDPERGHDGAAYLDQADAPGGQAAPPHGLVRAQPVREAGPPPP